MSGSYGNCSASAQSRPSPARCIRGGTHRRNCAETIFPLSWRPVKRIRVGHWRQRGSIWRKTGVCQLARGWQCGSSHIASALPLALDSRKYKARPRSAEKPAKAGSAALARFTGVVIQQRQDWHGPSVTTHHRQPAQRYAASTPQQHRNPRLASAHKTSAARLVAATTVDSTKVRQGRATTPGRVVSGACRWFQSNMVAS